MEYRYRMSQDELAYTYEHAQARMDAHPEYADKQKLIIQAQSFSKARKMLYKQQSSKGRTTIGAVRFGQ